MGISKSVAKYSIWGFLALAAFLAGLWVSNMLSYDFKTVEGKKYKQANLKNNIVLVNYFAEWCAPCLREIPELNEFYHQAGDKVKLFAVSFDNLNEKQLKQIKAKYNIEFPLISTFKTEFAFDKPQYLPATFIIKPSGEVAGQLLGEQTAKGLQEAISTFQID